LNFLYEQYNLIITQFHWLRPLWLLALLPALVLSVFLWRQKRKAYQWQQLIAPELLPFLLDGKTVQTKKSLIWVLLFAWIISCIAVAGPSWVKRPTPVEKNQNALVILLDLSYSMISEDVKPSRIARARLKIADVLRERKDGQTALIAYAGEAHTVTPISDDSATILSLLSSMHPNIMPLQGSNTEDAIARSIQLFQDAGATQGDILLVTDGVVPEAFEKIQSLLAGKKIQLSILGVGTTQPAPIPSPNGGFLRDNSGAIITTQLNSAELTQLTERLHGRYHEISNNNSDIEFLKPREHKDDADKPTLKRDFDQWVDNGHWLIFLLLPIALFCFRRGLLLSLLLIPMLGFTPSPSYAFGLDDVWLTKDQQAQRELNKGDAKKAAEQFTSPEWKASAQYRAGDYTSAVESFAKIDTASGHYNRGNALAKSGKLEDAIKAYDEALKRDANLEDAKKNRALAEKLLKQQKDQKQDQRDKDKNKDDKSKDKKDQQNKDDKQDSEKKDGDQQNQDSKSQNDKESQDQEKKDQQQSNSQSSSGNNGKDQAKESAQQSSQSAQQSSQEANKAQSGQSSSAGQAQTGSQASSATGSAGNAAQQAAQMDESKLTPEQKQALEQWLRRVPDDPAGLLRNKFKYQYDLNRQKRADGELKSPENNADQRL
jgi:Ca-activated chloride channel family protein